MRTFRVIVCAGLLLANALPAAEVSPKGTFDDANRLYDQEQYGPAAEIYAQLLREGPVSPVILFNLGNAHFKAAHIGKAIAAYRQGVLLNPRDPDLRANLTFARGLVQGPSLLPRAATSILSRLTVHEALLLAAAPFWAAFFGLAIGQLRPNTRPMLRWPIRVAAGLAVILGALALLVHRDAAKPVAVVIVDSVVIRKGPLEESSTAFTAMDGAELEVIDGKGDWYHVAANSRQHGWVPKAQVIIHPLPRMQQHED